MPDPGMPPTPAGTLRTDCPGEGAVGRHVVAARRAAARDGLVARDVCVGAHMRAITHVCWPRVPQPLPLQALPAGRAAGGGGLADRDGRADVATGGGRGCGGRGARGVGGVRPARR
eukprot:365535-Chlamydomonas_euryale.AAC.24